MLKFHHLFLLSFFSGVLFILSQIGSEKAIASKHTDVWAPAQQHSHVLLAQRGKKKRSNKSKTKVRKRNLIQEKKYRGQSKDVDFDAIDITGQRENPLGSALINKRANKEFDLINIREDWKPEMVQSTSSLETGRGR